MSPLAQLTVPPVNEVTAGDGGLQSTVITIVLLVAFLVVAGLVLWRVLRRPKAIEAKPADQALPGATATQPLVSVPKVVLAPSEEEARKLAEAEAARKQADEVRRKREALAAEAKGADDTQRAKLEAEAKALKADEETAKKQAYQAQKAAEAEEKDRHQREREEGKRRAEEAAAKAIEEAAQRAKAEAEAEKVRAQAQSGKTLFAGLQKTKNEGFMSRLNGLFSGAPKVIDEAVLGELEELLFTADIGVKTAQGLVAVARDRAKKNELTLDKLKGVIRVEVERIVDLRASHTLGGGGPPHVIMVVGVNGSGKTTTIGKLAAKATAMGKKVVLAAGDTFRAAAAEQLDVWAERAKAQLVKGKEDSDPSSVIFEAIKLAKETHADLVIADTAGRLHTQTPLMEELKKVKRVIEKALPGAPHEVLLVLDSTNGQNAIMQARQFQDAVGITAIALTKLDGTAKGGVIIGICDELKLPVAWAGVGEQIADLRPFEPKEFVQALFD